MPNNLTNKIKRLELENFTCFGKVALDFSPGINVFIGENGTGKTHLMKVLYGVDASEFIYPPTYWDKGDDEINTHLESKLMDVFNIFNIIELKNSHAHSDNFRIKILKHHEKQDIGKRNPINLRPSLFIPVNEMLSWQEHFIGNNFNRESGFDITWFDLAIALDRGVIKGKEYEEAKKLVILLEEAISADIIKKDKKFYFRFHNNGQSEQEAGVVAQGINKLGQIIYLILNGSLNKDTILFWDEPETGLNPKYITVITKFLLALANAGCQIFVSTHDYLLAHQLSLFSEYRDTEPNVPPMKFFSLTKGENGTEVESADAIVGIQNNSILDEYVNYHDLQFNLKMKEVQKT